MLHYQGLLTQETCSLRKFQEHCNKIHTFSKYHQIFLGLMWAMSFSYHNSGQLNGLFVSTMFPDGDNIGLFAWSLKKFKYWCLSHLKNKSLAKISWGMRTRRWNMNVCFGLLLVILKYSQWYFWSAVALACCAQADTWGWIFQQWSDLAVTVNG